MLQASVRPALVMMASSLALGQTPAARPSFDVASIRVSEGRVMDPFRMNNIQFTPESVTMRNTSLKACIRWAYDVMEYQVSGPDWLQNQRFDIAAKAPGPSSEKELRQMAQTLLADRFKVEVHHQTKELPAYVLTVGKNGPKFKKSESDGEGSVDPDQKTMSVKINRATMTHLVDVLATFFHAPVIDMTGLKDKYDITVNVARYIADFQPAPGGAPPDPVSLITMGLQEVLGLKIESRKTTLDLVVVDHAEKVPVEN